ncbi:hypothetical protein HYH03_017929 [Edaphochlamys debaryana]|uniref:Uncharacterized protein n=1 Tax=Edaphochlamys debaryana TaxID=47281 RepID=A0A835XGY8_9CHLO|nr:hypothetical protein HYH03_017929 [Edaphochlamys debaryana]|eukprot:KAG2483194.1 hypothetical protein HYH03_017929 [Edaphochlamys debaryana]
MLCQYHRLQQLQLVARGVRGWRHQVGGVGPDGIHDRPARIGAAAAAASPSEGLGPCSSGRPPALPFPAPAAGPGPGSAASSRHTLGRRLPPLPAAASAASAFPSPAPRLPGAGIVAWLGKIFHYYKEIIQRAALTVGLLALIRCGHFIPLPGVELAAVAAPVAATTGERLIKALYGQASDIPASLFDLGISPWINASILLSLLLVLPQEITTLPGMEWLGRLREARKEGRTGEAVLNAFSNNLAVAFAVILALVKALELQPCALYGAASSFLPGTVLALVAGGCVIHFAANTITAYGLGNGSSLVICSSIISEYASTLHTVLAALDASLLSPLRLAAMLAGYLALVLFSVWLSTSELRLPVVQYATSAPPPPGQRGQGGGLQDLIAQARILAQKRSNERLARQSALGPRSQQPQQPAGGAAAAAGAPGTPAAAAAGAGAGTGPGAARPGEYFPLQLSSSGMMPIVLGGAAYYGFIPKMVQLITGNPAAAAVIGEALTSPLGLVGFGLTVTALEFLPLGGVNPKDIAEYFNTMNVGLRGVVPGEPTEKELRTKLLQCKFWGGAALGCLAVAAQLYDGACLRVLGTSLGTTSLLIIVGAVLQTARQVEGLLEGPKLQRRLDQERAAIESLSLL